MFPNWHNPLPAPNITDKGPIKKAAKYKGWSEEIPAAAQAANSASAKGFGHKTIEWCHVFLSVVLMPLEKGKKGLGGAGVLPNGLRVHVGAGVANGVEV